MGAQPLLLHHPLIAESDIQKPGLRTTGPLHCQSSLTAKGFQRQRESRETPSSVGQRHPLQFWAGEQVMAGGTGFSLRPLTKDSTLGSVDITSFTSSSTMSRARDLRTFLMGLRRSWGWGGGRQGRHLGFLPSHHQHLGDACPICPDHRPMRLAEEWGRVWAVQVGWETLAPSHI